MISAMIILILSLLIVVAWIVIQPAGHSGPQFGLFSTDARSDRDQARSHDDLSSRTG